MTSKIAIQYAKNALEKQDAQAYANLSNWNFEDAFNKEAIDWFRKQDWGNNVRKEGEEESEILVDDLQTFLTEKKLTAFNKENYADTVKKPDDYFFYNRLSVIASKKECSNIEIPSKLVESSNVDTYLSDYNFSPDFDFEQCFHILIGDKFRIFHGRDFKINSAKLYYFRYPHKISCELDQMDTPWEYKEDVAQLIIDNAVRQLAGNIEHQSQEQYARDRINQTT